MNKKKFKKIIKSVFILTLVSSWLLSGWPGIKIGQNSYFPPRIKEAHAAVAFRAASGKANGTGAVTPNLPSGVAANDIVILVASTTAGGSMSITANGSIATWTAITGTPVDVTGGEKLYAWWGRYSSGSTGPTVTPVGDHAIAATIAYSGAISSVSPIDVTETGTETTSDITFSFATSVSSTIDNTKAIVIYSSGADSNTGQGGTLTNTSLSNVTLELEYNANSSGGGGFILGDGNKATAGTLGTWVDSAMVSATPKSYVTFNLIPQPTTTLSTSSDPAAATVAPGSGIRSAGQFTYTTSAGSDTITNLTLTLAGSPAGSYAAIDSVSIRETSCSGTLYFSAVTPSSNSVSFSGGTALPVSTGGNTYYICVTPKDHTLASGTYSISPYISNTWTSGSGNIKTGTDSNANALTIDNTAPSGATTTSGSAGDYQATINWTTSSSGDFNTTSGSVVYRWASGSAGSEVPAEDSTPSVGSTNGTATVACVVSSNGSTAIQRVDGDSESDCTTAALTNGQAYTYMVFQKDNYGNYDAGISIGTITPAFPGITISGNAYADEATTVWTGCNGSTNNISVVVNGIAKATTSCDGSTGAYSFSYVIVAANNPVSVFFNATDKGAVVTVIVDPRGNITLNPRKNIIWLKTETGISNITNANLDHCDSGVTGCSNVPYTVTAGSIQADAGNEIHIESTKTYAPGGDVSADKLHVVGIYSGISETLTLSGIGSGTSRPLYVNGGTFNVPTTIIFTGAGSFDIEATTYTNLTVNNASAVGSLMAAIGVSGTLTVTAGTLDTTSGGSYSLSAGTISIGISGVLNIRSSTLTINGTSGTLLTNSGAFTAGASSTTKFTGATAPTALLSGSFTGANSFGSLEFSPTISGNIAYSIGTAFNATSNFTINPTATSTYTLTATLAGNSTVTGTTLLSGTTSGKSTLNTNSGSNYTFSTGILNISAAGTLNANSSNAITINGTSATIFSQAGVLNAGGSTVVISGSGAVSLTAATTFNNISITGTSTTSNNFTVNGSLNISGSGNLSASGGTITMATTALDYCQ